MFCGFGAVVLLVMLLHGKTLKNREETQKDLRAEVARVDALHDIAQEQLDKLQREVESIELEQGELVFQAEQHRLKIREDKQQINRAQQAARQRERRIEELKQQKAMLEEEKEKNSTTQSNNRLSGTNKIGFDGEGRRQYLTGLKLGGDRTLILIDASASMLDETVVNVIRRKLMHASIRKRSPKWLRVVRSLHWLVANLQPDKRFQVYYFNTEARPVISATDGMWINTSDSGLLDTTVSSIREIAPEKGTSLHKAFAVITKLKPKPDSILLLTDGLPTQGKSSPSSATISAEERKALFFSAVKSLPSGIPVNTLLFPMEGDPAAAAAFWQLAIETHGSFITPSRDWP